MDGRKPSLDEARLCPKPRIFRSSFCRSLHQRPSKWSLPARGSDELLGGYPKHRAETRGRALSIDDAASHPRCGRRACLSVHCHSACGGQRSSLPRPASGDFTNRMRYWFGGMSIRDRDLMLGQSLSRPTAGPISIFDGRRVEWPQDDVLRSDIVVAGRSS